MWFAVVMLLVIAWTIRLGTYPALDDVTAIRYLLTVVGVLLALAMVALNQLISQTRGSAGR